MIMTAILINGIFCAMITTAVRYWYANRCRACIVGFVDAVKAASAKDAAYRQFTPPIRISR